MDLDGLIQKIGINRADKNNKSVEAYGKNFNENIGLRALISEFINLTNGKLSIEFYPKEEPKIPGYSHNIYYSHLFENFNADYTLADIEVFASSPEAYKRSNDEDYSSKFGLFTSAAINKIIKKGQTIHINSPMRINYLFYKLKDAEAHVSNAGHYFGYWAENSKIFVGDAWDFAGYFMDNSELWAEKVRDKLGHGSRNSKIYVDKARDYAGDYMDNSELRAKKVGDYLGYDANSCTIYADEVGLSAGNNIRNSEIHVIKAGAHLGFAAVNSNIYAEEAGKYPGHHMMDSNLYINKLHGRLSSYCFGKDNQVYLGEQTYKERSLYGRMCRLRGIKTWERQN